MLYYSEVNISESLVADCELILVVKSYLCFLMYYSVQWKTHFALIDIRYKTDEVKRK